VEEWLDCGNKDATVYTNQRILDIKQDSEELVSSTAKIENSVVILPCYIGKNVSIRNSVIGPYVSLEEGAQIDDCRIKNSIVQAQSVVKNSQFENSMLGKNVTYIEKPRELSLGDFSTQS
jgi:glucose-1-phosphate thymidylyltransferase